MKSILVVDDEECLVEMLCEYLNLNGYCAVGFVSPIEALEEFTKNKYDVVITDYNMPEMNGMELVNSIFKISNTTRIIMLTGHTNLSELRSSYKIKEVLTKPTKYSKLMEILDGL